MHHEEKDDLWELLGKARQPAVPPFFARNVLREVRSLQQKPVGILAAFFWRLRSGARRWQMAVTSVCAIGIASGTFVAERSREMNRQERQQIAAIAQRVSASPEYQVIDHLDELLDSEKDSVWLDPGASTY